MFKKKSRAKKKSYVAYKGSPLMVFMPKKQKKENENNLNLNSFFEIKMLGKCEKRFKIDDKIKIREDQLINKVLLMGNLGRDPETFKKDDLKIVSFSLATSKRWKDKASGEKKEITQWHKVSILNDNISEIAEKYLKKGSKVFIEGELQNKKWKDREGKERETTEVVLPKFGGELFMISPPPSKESQGHTNHPVEKTSVYECPDFYNDDIPF